MNIPNLLTLFRVFLVPAIVILLMRGDFLKALVFFAIAGITDGLDGFLAKILNQRTILGSYLDPLADKALISASFVTLSILGIIPGWLAVVVISRDLIILLGISILFFMSAPVEIKPAYISKITTTLQLLTIFTVLTFKCLPEYFNYKITELTFWLTTFFTVASGLNYIYKGTKLINGENKSV